MTSPQGPGPLEQLAVLEAPDGRDVQFLDDRIYECNVARTGISDARLLAIILRDGDHDITAGFYGWTWGQCCEVKTLWVHHTIPWGTGALCGSGTSSARAPAPGR